MFSKAIPLFDKKGGVGNDIILKSLWLTFLAQPLGLIKNCNIFLKNTYLNVFDYEGEL